MAFPLERSTMAISSPRGTGCRAGAGYGIGIGGRGTLLCLLGMQITCPTNRLVGFMPGFMAMISSTVVWKRRESSHSVSPASMV